MNGEIEQNGDRVELLQIFDTLIVAVISYTPYQIISWIVQITICIEPTCPVLSRTKMVVTPKRTKKQESN